jgi:hypothetical protein
METMETKPVSICQSIWCNISEDLIVSEYRCENFILRCFQDCFLSHYTNCANGEPEVISWKQQYPVFRTCGEWVYCRFSNEVRIFLTPEEEAGYWAFLFFITIIIIIPQWVYYAITVSCIGFLISYEKLNDLFLAKYMQEFLCRRQFFWSPLPFLVHMTRDDT